MVSACCQWEMQLTFSTEIPTEGTLVAHVSAQLLTLYVCRATRAACNEFLIVAK